MICPSLYVPPVPNFVFSSLLKYPVCRKECFIKDDATLRAEELALTRAPISNSLIYSQIIQRKIMPPTCDNILNKFHNNRIEDISPSANIPYSTRVKCEPQ